MRLLDLYCGAGGCSVGYARAGFDVVGVDLHPQPNYPYEFHQADALRFDIEYEVAVMADGHRSAVARLPAFDAIHASPPCQTHVKGLAGVNAALGRESKHADLITQTRELLRATGLPYVIENVVGAPLIDPVRLCGSSLGLAVRRHRLFETNWPLIVPPCQHGTQTERRYWTSWRPNGEHRLASVVQVYGNAGDSSEWAAAMQIDWMTRDELREAIPPAMTELIGHQLAQWISTSKPATEGSTHA